jgi:hypothetical protein
MFARLFLDHPRSVDETYGEHFRVASRVGVLLIGAGLAAFVHAIVPEWHKRTGSRTIRRLNAELQGRQPTEAELNGELNWVI